jgi:DNA-binding transcriptional regulator GbsR (MarR family)
MKLSPAQQKFILHWGEMGTRWGVNRTVAQIHALLYLSPDPLPAEEIAATLGVARSNVSTSLRELEGWGIVRVVHLLGDRRDHFVSLPDVWEMFRIIAQERKRREVDPTLAVLKECVQLARETAATDKHMRERLLAMQEFLESMSSLYEEVRSLPTGSLRRFAKLRGQMRRIIPGALSRGTEPSTSGGRTNGEAEN